MSDTTEQTDHIAAIRRRLANIVQWAPDLGGIVAEARHADRDLDALARELAEAEARAERWRRLAAAIIRHDNAEAMGVIDLSAELDEVDAARADLIAHGDLPDDA